MLTENIGGIPSIITSGGGNGDGMGFGGGWGFILGLLFGRGGLGGFGGYGNGTGVAGVDNTVWEAQNFARLEAGHNALQSQLSGIGQGLCDSTFALNNSIKDGQFATAMGIQGINQNLGNAICSSTFELSKAIDSCCLNVEAA